MKSAVVCFITYILPLIVSHLFVHGTQFLANEMNRILYYIQYATVIKEHITSSSLSMEH